MKYNNTIPYAMDFSSFLLEHLSEKTKEHIKSIILFGSGARGEQNKESDVDIFIETSGELGELERETEKIAEDFFNSVKYLNYWKLKGLNYLFSCRVGNSEAWKNLYPAFVSDGVTLYGKYYPVEAQDETRALFFWENVRSSNKRINLFRSLYGYRARGKKYKGLLERYGGEKLTKGCILMPLESHQEVSVFFKKLGVSVKKLFASIF